MRTIESPGVQINEIDLSLRANLPTGTNVFVTGFAQKGPADEILQVTSLGEFEQIYGKPQTPAERYFYHSVRPLFNTAAKIFTYRLPYGANTGLGFGTNYGALVYPCSAFHTSEDGKVIKGLATYNEQDENVTFVLGKPIHFELTKTDYDDIVQGHNFTWNNTFTNNINQDLSNLGKSAIIILNKSQTTIDNLFQGYYAGVIDNTNLTPSTNFDGVKYIQTISSAVTATSGTNYTTIPLQRLGFALSAQSDANTITFGQDNDSVSEVLENLSKFDIGSKEFDDTLSLGIFKIRQSVFAPDTIILDYSLAESFVASVDYHREVNSQTGGAPLSFALETAEDQSPNIQILINPYLSRKNTTTWLNTNGYPANKIRIATEKWLDNTYWNAVSSRMIANTTSTVVASSYATLRTLATSLATTSSIDANDSLYPLGAYSTTNIATKTLGSVPQKIDRALEIVSNVELFNVDLVVDGGLSTIYSTRNTANDTFDDTTYNGASSGLRVSDPATVTGDALTLRDNWKTIFDRFANFCQYARQDCMYIADLPRHIFIQNKSFKVLDDSAANFSQYIYNPIRAITSVVNTSHATAYANWAKVYDSVLDDQTWVPFSGIAAANFVNTDTNFQPWFAPAGFTRGIVAGVNDLAIYPTQKQRDQLYRISTNPVAFFPNEGFVIYGQKTMLKKPSAFDRINVRRLFLNLEKAVRDTVKFFVFEPNTLLTRTRVVNTLTPIFENAKNTEGLYDYLIVCDERNNPGSVIDANELVVDIYLKPVRSAEFILVNFYATRTETNFQELVG